MRDPASAVVRADGTVDWRGAKMTPGEDDPAALAVAKAVATDGRTAAMTESVRSTDQISVSLIVMRSLR